MLTVDNLLKLNFLDCGRNQISILNVTNLINLNFLACGINQISVLDVEKLDQLYLLVCVTNQIETLNVTALTNLTTLDCSSNLLLQAPAEQIATALFNNNIYTGILNIIVQTSGDLDISTLPFTALQTVPFEWVIE